MADLLLKRFLVPKLKRTPTTSTAVFIIIEPVDRAGVGCRLIEVLRACFYQLRRTNMLAARDRANIYDARRRERQETFSRYLTIHRSNRSLCLQAIDGSLKRGVTCRFYSTELFV